MQRQRLGCSSDLMLWPHSVCKVLEISEFWGAARGAFQRRVTSTRSMQQLSSATVINVSCYTTYRDHTSLLLSRTDKVWTSRSPVRETAGGGLRESQICATQWNKCVFVELIIMHLCWTGVRQVNAVIMVCWIWLHCMVQCTESSTVYTSWTISHV